MLVAADCCCSNLICYGLVVAIFEAPDIDAQECTLTLKAPKINFPPAFRLPPFNFPPAFLPHLTFEFSLSCDAKKPIKLTSNILPGAGRPDTSLPSADDRDD